MSEHTIRRREFLKGSAALAGGFAVGAVSAGRTRAADATGPPVKPPASETIRFGLIGCGGMGNAHLDAVMALKSSGYPVEIAVVCDVYSVRADAAGKKTGAKVFGDYREILDMADVDAVGIATPDHWHARMTVAAAEAGKDVYCEKPMTHWRDLNEARRVVAAIEGNRRVMQVGTQGMSDSVWEDLAKRIRSGAVGKLIHAQASDMRNGPLGVYDPRTNDGVARPGENLDWDMWLGPAPRREWDPGRFFAFRSFWDYSGGVGTDFFPHILTPLVYAMGLDFPAKVTAIGGQYAYTEDGREIPDIFNVMVEYPGGPNVVLMGSLANGVNIPTVIRGHTATAFPGEGPGAVIRPQKSVDPQGEEVTIQRSRSGSLQEHYRNFFDCVKSREKPRSHEQLGYRVMAVLHMGIRSFREGRTMQFELKSAPA